MGSEEDLDIQSLWNLGLDSDLQSGAAVHLVQGSLVVVELEDVCDHTLDVDLASIEVGDGAREAVCLRERADDLRQVPGQHLT